MSVCFELYRVCPDVDYLGHYLDKYSMEELRNVKCKEWEILDNLPEADKAEYENSLEAASYSDNKKHSRLILTTPYKNERSLKRMNKKLLNHFNFKSYNTNMGYIEKYIVTDSIGYRQGWNLKSRFFNKEWTEVVCLTKKEMMNFLRNNLVLTGEKGKQSLEMINYFEGLWEKYEFNGEQLVFTCAW